MPGPSDVYYENALFKIGIEKKARLLGMPPYNFALNILFKYFLYWAEDFYYYAKDKIAYAMDKIANFHYYKLFIKKQPRLVDFYINTFPKYKAVCRNFWRQFCVTLSDELDRIFPLDKSLFEFPDIPDPKH